MPRLNSRAFLPAKLVEDQDLAIDRPVAGRVDVADRGGNVGTGHVAPRVIVTVDEEQSGVALRGSGEWFEVDGIAGQNDRGVPLRRLPDLCVADPETWVDDFVSACRQPPP